MTHTRDYTYACVSCDTPRPYGQRLTFTGHCLECAEAALVGNIMDLQDKGSVAYKVWRNAWSVSHYGRPKNTTPPAAWIPRGGSLQIRHTIHGDHSITFTD